MVASAASIRPRARASARTNDLLQDVSQSSAASSQSPTSPSNCWARSTAPAGCCSVNDDVVASGSRSSHAHHRIKGANMRCSAAASCGCCERKQAASASRQRTMEFTILGRIWGSWSIAVDASVISGIVCGCTRADCSSHSAAMPQAISSVGNASTLLLGVRISRPSMITRQSFRTRRTPTLRRRSMLLWRRWE